MFRRFLALLLLVSAAAFVVAGPAFAAGADVLRDYKEGGVIDQCYSDAEFNDALKLARKDTAQYGAAPDAIAEKQIECAENPTAAPAATDSDGGGANTALWAIVVGALAAGAVAFGVAARKRRDG
jgi:hypothetical protein